MKRLGKILAPDKFSMDKEDLLCYGYDASGINLSPAAVVWPADVNDVSAICAFAYDNNFRLVPRGAGTGMTGGSTPSSGKSILISMERMNRILDIDTGNLNVVVEPGVINGRLQKELAPFGYFYPPDPTSMNYCTIGGNVAENAGGARSLKYGVTGDYVMELEAVLPDGRVIKTGIKTAKGVVGYDLKRLLIGSEGTLALITKIRLKILPIPESVVALLVFYKSLEDAGRSVSKIIASGAIPRTMEIMDRTTIRVVNQYRPIGLPSDADAALLIELDGNNKAIMQEAEKISVICNELRGSVRLAEDEASRDVLWEARRGISPALYKISPTKINEDIVVPIGKIPDALMEISKLSKSSGIPIACFGHAGDGNIHVNILTDKDDSEGFEKAEKLVRKVFEITLALGGTISGEHGVGLTKAKYIEMELDSGVLDLMRAIKKLFDHKNILNPGKIFV